MNDSHMGPPHLGFRNQPPIPRHAINACPTSIGTYAALHLDSIGKIVNHFLFLTVFVDVFLFLCSFAVSYLPNHMGPNTVLCSFLLVAVPITNLLIVNNSRISALSVLAPTEFMVGVATGLTIGAAVLSFILSSSYKTVRHCGEILSIDEHHNSTTHQSDPTFVAACSNTTTMTGIYFWAGLSAWLSVVTAMLLVTGHHELSEHYQRYEAIGGYPNGTMGGGGIGAGVSPPPPQHHDFEETFRRQQQEILGVSQAAALQNRAASLFVGDYSSIPEVRDPNSSMSTVTLQSHQHQQQQPQVSPNNSKKPPQVLSV